MMKGLTWRYFLSEEKKLSYFKNILSYLEEQKKKGIVYYPKQKDIFNAFRFTSFESVKVVIIGQDPYHGPNQAHGLAFSVLPGVLIPPSLRNIYKELVSDIPDFIMPNHGCLKNWANEGVLLLNSVLTVEAGKSYSHAHIGWELFTDKVIRILSIYKEKIVFMLWGRYAQKKGNIINKKKHYILTASHPSPISAQYGFLGCRHFSRANMFLMQQDKQIINWQPKIGD
ncbi:uracil-DNA glycosylase [Blochmannia endosymbiont of Camponotus sp.]|uniref:uracil-DNA glycosylase n=1 Tax=Blochmannia endosymbiont of Camponotus sp. TaxID=700220 RepID=UPI0020240F54|nr:uracil-DNA glycosylase [Blochmannia endosymbiont of Camponotus sp.]URJ29865.1 uracil-DNA glycosylase [Blochmannia endosymbiont of Camponotus sp.]